MSSVVDFDYNEMAETLASLGRQFPEGSTEERAIHLAFLLLLYTSYDRRRLKAFREWHAEGRLPASQIPFNASHEFATQEEADAWRASGQATDGERVLIAGQGYEVVDVPPYGLKFRWVALPEQWAALGAEDEEPSDS